jgi:hypothetical protein
MGHGPWFSFANWIMWRCDGTPCIAVKAVAPNNRMPRTAASIFDDVFMKDSYGWKIVLLSSIYPERMRIWRCRNNYFLVGVKVSQ